MSWAERRARRQAAGAGKTRKLVYEPTATPAELESMRTAASKAHRKANAAEARNEPNAGQLRAQANAARIRSEQAHRGAK